MSNTSFVTQYRPTPPAQRMSKIAFFFSLMLGLFLVGEIKSDSPTAPEDVKFLGGTALGIILFLALVGWQTRSQPKFLGLSFLGWIFGFALSFLVGSIAGFFMGTN